jgi:hypothetical protein
MGPTATRFQNLCRLIVREQIGEAIDLDEPLTPLDEAYTMWREMSNEEKYIFAERYNLYVDVRQLIDQIQGIRGRIQEYAATIQPAMARTIWIESLVFTFPTLCEAIQERRARLSSLSVDERPLAESALTDMIVQGRNMWDGMEDAGKDYTALRYALHAGVRRTIQLVPELHESFMTYPSPYTLVRSTPAQLLLVCRQFFGRSGTPALSQTLADELTADACAIWHELSDGEKAEVSRDYVGMYCHRSSIQAIPALFALYRQHVPTLWQQMPREQRDHVLRRYVAEEHVRLSTSESGMAEFIEAHRDLVELEAFVRYELAVRAYDTAYWDRFWQ